MEGHEAYDVVPEFKSKANAIEMDLRQFPVYALSSHDLVFPLADEQDEVHTLSMKARSDILKNVDEWDYAHVVHDMLVEYVFPEYEDDADLDIEPGEEIGDASTGELHWLASESERKALQLAHNNLGHPRQEDFARLLRRGSVRPEVVRWVSRHSECPACAHNQEPDARIPAGAPRTFSPNMVVGMDCFHMMHPLSQENEAWLQCGTEFQGVFALACGQYGTLTHTIDTNTPWLNARTETCQKGVMHYFEIKWRLHWRIGRSWTPTNDDEYLTLVYHSVNMGNTHSSRGGYSPVQRVLGYTAPLPESILSDEVRPAMISEGPLDAVRRSEHLRNVAREAWAKFASRSRLLRAMRSKDRGPTMPLKNGDGVWVWREGVNSARPGSWQGLGSIVCLTPTGTFVSLRGQLWKVNSRNLRIQEEEDQLADSMVSRYLSNLRHDLSQEGLRSQRKFVDCTRDHEPRGPPGLDEQVAAPPEPEAIN
eukprot:361404-Amphidinium_carterae.1